MRPNIRTEEGLSFLILTLDVLIFKAKRQWPRKHLLLTMSLLLRWFFSVKWHLLSIDWRGSNGQSLCARLRSSKSFFNKYLILESRFRTNAKLIARFVDDMLIVWEKAKAQPGDWKDVKLCSNNVSNLNRVCKDLVKSVVFLDLNIWIDYKRNALMREPHTKRNHFSYAQLQILLTQNDHRKVWCKVY